jgi:transcription antitermination factor NusG
VNRYFHNVCIGLRWINFECKAVQGGAVCSCAGEPMRVIGDTKVLFRLGGWPLAMAGKDAPHTIALLAVRTGSELTVRAQAKVHGLQTYVPQYLVNQRHAGMVAKALFPGYVFVWVQDQWRLLLRMLHVHDFLRCGEEIIHVDPKIVKDLRKREGPTGYVRINSKFFIGQHVALQRAPNLAGTYMGLTDTYKARVLFTLLGRSAEVDLYEHDLVVVA